MWNMNRDNYKSMGHTTCRHTCISRRQPQGPSRRVGRRQSGLTGEQGVT